MIRRLELREHLFAAAFTHDYTTLSQYVKLYNIFKCFVKQSRIIRRIEKDKVEFPARAQVAERLALHHVALQAAEREIGAHELHGGAALIDEHGAARTAAERLDAELARAGKEVEHAPALDVELDEVEHGFLDVIGRGTGGHPLRLVQPAAAGRACDHAHGGSPFG